MRRSIERRLAKLERLQDVKDRAAAIKKASRGPPPGVIFCEVCEEGAPSPEAVVIRGVERTACGMTTKLVMCCSEACGETLRNADGIYVVPPQLRETPPLCHVCYYPCRYSGSSMMLLPQRDEAGAPLEAHFCNIECQEGISSDEDAYQLVMQRRSEREGVRNQRHAERMAAEEALEDEMG